MKKLITIIGIIFSSMAFAQEDTTRIPMAGTYNKQYLTGGSKSYQVFLDKKEKALFYEYKRHGKTKRWYFRKVKI